MSASLARGSAPFIITLLIGFFSSVALRIFIDWRFLFVSILFLAGLAFVLIFFRDPERNIGNGIVAAADGVVRKIEQRDGWIAIETFMNVHNVHVNRAPLAGTVVSVERIHGGCAPAYKDSAEKNERVIIKMKTAVGEIEVVQIVGIFARRIVPYIKVGQRLSKGERIGMIRFGSRVDLYLPYPSDAGSRIDIKVKPGEHVRAGETTVAVADVPVD